MITRTNINSIQETGRLGNQMWAIASTIGIAKRNSTDYSFLRWSYQEWFKNELPNNYDINYYLRSNKFRLYTETSPYYQDINLDNSYAWDLHGYFQSYKYFEDYRNIIRHYFTPDFKMNDFSKDMVAVHVRRGDYLNLQNTHPILSKEYYQNAMEMFPGEKFLIFSDDIEWAMTYGWFDPSYCTFKVDERANSTDVPLDLLHLMYMSQCKSFIIANSSFSWWAAYLNNNPNKIVVAPRTWVLNEDQDDRVPPEWVRI